MAILATSGVTTYGDIHYERPQATAGDDSGPRIKLSPGQKKHTDWYVKSDFDKDESLVIMPLLMRQSNFAYLQGWAVAMQ